MFRTNSYLRVSRRHEHNIIEAIKWYLVALGIVPKDNYEGLEYNPLKVRQSDLEEVI